jgi:uncharacterized RDD family membrane protein YckC
MKQVSRGRTVGQWVIGIRVRQRANPEERIGLPQAYLRTLIKDVLGGLSFLVMGFNRERRALHDLAVGSIVLNENAGLERASRTGS